MVLNLLIAFIGLISLLILHESSHFILAKKFGVKVEEFGIGYPPRIFGKKIGQTLYSLNLLPFGAFVRIPEMEEPQDPFRPSVGKRILIASGGVLSFWIMAAIIFSVVFNLGTRVAIDDLANSNLIDPKVQIADIAHNSPAQISGLKVGDTIREFKILDSRQGEAKFKIEKMKEIQELTEQYKGQEVILTIERGREIFEVKIIPRISPPAGEGPMGVTLVRTTIKKYPFPLAIWQGTLNTGKLTLAIIEGYFQAISNLFKGLPSGVELRGAVGIFQMLKEASQLGLSYFLNFLALIAIYLALFNILPIPAADGGKLLFLGIEAVRRKPIPLQIEQKITAAFFTMIIVISIWITIQDIARIF